MVSKSYTLFQVITACCSYGKQLSKSDWILHKIMSLVQSHVSQSTSEAGSASVAGIRCYRPD